MSGTWASGWALNDIVTVGEFAKGVGCVADATLAVPTASFDFSSLPTTYAHLLIELYARGDAAGSSTSVALRFNNDNGANYDYQSLRGSATTVAATESFAQSFIQVGTTPLASVAANLFSVCRIEVLHYAGSANNKAVLSRSFLKGGTSTGNLATEEFGGGWRSSAAINRVTLLPGAGGNWLAGSRASIYVMGS